MTGSESGSGSISLSEVSVSVSLKSVESTRLYAGGLECSCWLTGRSNRFLWDCCLHKKLRDRITVLSYRTTYLNLDLTERLLSAAVRANSRLTAAAPREASPPTNIR